MHGIPIRSAKSRFRRADAFVEFSFRRSQASTSCRYVAVEGKLAEFDAPAFSVLGPDPTYSAARFQCLPA